MEERRELYDDEPAVAGGGTGVGMASTMARDYVPAIFQATPWWT
jgi:hypothetical protein